MNLIVAVDSQWGIGKNGGLLTYLPEDLPFFKKMTTGHVIVLGRKTLESFPQGKPLKDRINLVISSTLSASSDTMIVCPTLEKALEKLKSYSSDEIFIVGGGSIYTQFLPYCTTAYVTKINQCLHADTFIPNLDISSQWQLIEEGTPKQYNTLEYRFTKYIRH